MEAIGSFGAYIIFLVDVSVSTPREPRISLFIPDYDQSSDNKAIIIIKYNPTMDNTTLDTMAG
jgi:hypothetical protein